MRISAKHQTAPSGKKVQIGAQPYRGAPIRTCPTPAVETDLLGHEIINPKRTNDRPEAAALAEVLKVMESHPAVAWCHLIT